ncbi:hypothetical protein [Shewanella sp. GXUN23E]|uniref:hypothetical protein n=1 Tax=Shewanella sp. GXUN23E TaxID=3422498 RepID=UPI003D7EB1FE
MKQPKFPQPMMFARYLMIMLVMGILAWLLLADTREKSRATLLLEYQELFVATYQAAVGEAKLQGKTEDQQTIEMDGIKVNLLNGYPSPRSMLTLMGLPDCSIEKTTDAICVTKLASHLSLSVSGEGLDSQIILYPSEMQPQQWWQGCMLIYTKVEQASGAPLHLAPQLYLDNC